MLALIDWTRRWYDSVRPAFQGLDIDALGVIGAFNATAGLPVRFVPQAELPGGRAYEEFIGATGCVPTRENLHDFFNGLVWLTFPRIKRQLNVLQAAQIALAGVGKSRGAARDGATIFDENCALLVVREGAEALVDALRAHQWSEALFERRGAFGGDVQVWLFGHALMEKLVAPRKAITAHTLVVSAPDSYFDLAWNERRMWIDAHVASLLVRDGITTASFTPLPVLGVPGWWEGQDAAFYADTSVFRPKRLTTT
ncbi:MAG: DUF3025 domain-containing protein [Pseudomonadota bacterium]